MKLYLHARKTGGPRAISGAFPLQNRLLSGVFSNRARLPDYLPYFLNSGSPKFGVALIDTIAPGGRGCAKNFVMDLAAEERGLSEAPLDAASAGMKGRLT